METPTLKKIDGIKEFFKNKSVLTINELRNYYRSIDSNFKETTFKWRIHVLKQKKLIRSVKRGVYTLQSRPIYQLEISDRLKKRYKEIKKEFPYSKCCVWETKWLNQLMIHLPGNFMDLIEVESEAAESVFYFLQNRSSREKVYFKPSEKEIEQYIAANQHSIIIRPLVTQAPMKEQDVLCIPKLEKILVDLFVDTTLFMAYQGQELITIFENAYNQFPVNISTLFRYAHRRRRKDQLKDFLQKNQIVPDELLVK